MTLKLPDLAEKIIDTDVLIVGSECAGARAAIEASKYAVKVIAVTKGRIGASGATVTAGADVEIDGKSAHDLFGLSTDPRDSKEALFEDIVREGKYVNDQRLVEIHVHEAPLRIKELLDWGMKVRAVFQNPGHSYRRGLLTSGSDIVKALRNGIRTCKDAIEIIEDMMVTDLLTNNGRVVGATALDLCTGDFIVFRAKAVVLATGGGLRIFKFTDGPDELTGDGQAMALRIGAEFIDMEFVQFLENTFLYPPITIHPVTRLLQRKAGWLLNKYGERFIEKWDPERMEATTRDIRSIAIMNEILEGRGAYLSIKHLPDNVIDGFFDLHYALREADKDFWEYLKRNAIDVFPGSHFFCGGIKINEACETNIPGLYAAGEVTGGLNGSNRLSGNAIPEALVLGARAGKFSAKYASRVSSSMPNMKQVHKLRNKVFHPLEQNDGVSPIKLKKRVQEIAYDEVGPLRESRMLQKAIREIEIIVEKELPHVCTSAKNLVYNREWIDALQVENMLQTLQLIAMSALMRTESRGNHYRRDYPAIDNKKWLKNIIAKRVEREIRLSTRPVPITKLRPSEGYEQRREKNPS